MPQSPRGPPRNGGCLRNALPSSISTASNASESSAISPLVFDLDSFSSSSSDDDEVEEEDEDDAEVVSSLPD